MYRGKHSVQNTRKNYNKKPFVLLISLVLLVALAVGGTFAYLKANTAPVINTFTAGNSGIEIKEETLNNVKTAINVSVTGNVPVYVRVAVIVNNVDENGNVLSTDSSPVPHSDKWQELGGYYYYKGVVNPGTAGVELPFLAQGQKIDFNGKTVDVMAQTIQAAGGFVSDKWGHDYVNGAWK